MAGSSALKHFSIQNFVCLKMSQVSARPLVTVYDEKNVSTGKTIALPAVFRAPIRPDVVNFVHTCMRFNTRQA